jgi:hypothetical protein
MRTKKSIYCPYSAYWKSKELEMTHLGKKRRGRTKEIEKPARW